MSSQTNVVLTAVSQMTTTSLNPNAEVFHSSQTATSSAAIDASSIHWSTPLAPDLAVTNISTGGLT